MTRRKRWLAAASLVLVLVTGVWVTRNAFVRSAPLDGTKFVLRTQLGDDGRALRFAREGLLAADGWLRASFGHRLERRVDVRLARTSNCMWIDQFFVDSTAWSDEDQICVYTSSPRWRSLRSDDGGRPAVEIIAHEAVHSAQDELGCVDEPGEHRFLWLMEGTAVFGAREAMIREGDWRSADTESYIRDEGGYLDGLSPLEYFEQNEGDPAAYQLWHRAVRMLVGGGNGAASLREFCAKVGEGADWRVAFRETFGVSVDAFYKRFEGTR